MADMQAQFMPPPFGTPAKPTPFEAMLDAQARGEWTGFHKVDMDKEAAFLSKIRAAEAAAHCGRFRVRGGSDNETTTAAWGRTSARARAALRSVARRSPERLEDLEATLLEFAEEFAGVGSSLPDGGGEPGGGGPELVLPLADGFGRLLAHGLCEFHGLTSFTRLGIGGHKELVVKPPRARARLASASSGAGDEEEMEEEKTKAVVDDVSEGHEEDPTAANANEEDEMEDKGFGEERKRGWRPPPTTCVQFLRDL